MKFGTDILGFKQINRSDCGDSLVFPVVPAAQVKDGTVKYFNFIRSFGFQRMNSNDFGDRVFLCLLFEEYGEIHQKFPSWTGNGDVT